MWQQNQRLQLHSTDYLSRAVSGGGSECGNRISDYNFTDYLSRAVSGGGSECGNRISDYNFTAQTISRERCLEEDLNVANAKISRGQCLEEDLNVAKSLEGSVWRRV